MKHYVYMIKSLADGILYKGYSTDFLKRLEAHNRGESRYTSKKIPWVLVYAEELLNKTMALIREKQLKRANISYLEWLMKQPMNLVKYHPLPVISPKARRAQVLFALKLPQIYSSILVSFLNQTDCFNNLKTEMVLRISLLIFLVQTSLMSHGQNDCFSDCSKIMKSNLPFVKKLSILKGCAIPSFSATTLAGKRIDSEKLKGKVIVINFWYIGCAPCRAEMPGLNKLVAKYRDKVEFLSFSKDDPQRLRDFLKKNSVDFEVIPNSLDLDQKFCVVAGYPTNMVIDRTGKVELIFSGGRVDDKAPEELINKLEPAIAALIKN